MHIVNTKANDTFQNVFRDHSWTGLVFAGCCLLLVACYVLLPQEGSTPWANALIPGCTALMLIGVGLWRRTVHGPGHWLAAISNQGVYINLRYSEGYAAHAGQGMIFVPKNDVALVRGVRETMTLPHRFGVTRHHLAFVDLMMTCPIPRAVHDMVSEHQHQFRKAGKDGPFPIRVLTNNTIRLSWSWLHPGHDRALHAFSHQFPLLSSCLSTYPKWERFDEGQQEWFLRELWRMGMCREAVFMTRVRKGVSAARARAMFEAEVNEERAETVSPVE